MKASGATPLRLLLGSFLALILVGTLLLMLPWATPDGRPIGWIDAVFTATSATCVTGLVVRDTGADFTLFGQLVILALIQLGGLGVMTFSLLVFGLVGKRLSLASRSLIERTLVGGGVFEDLWALLRMVFRFTLAAEIIGALALLAHWYPRMGAHDAAYSAVFHSVSAFCNAGFSLWSTSFTAYRDDLLVNLVVAALVVLGGLGFLTVWELHGRSRSLGRRLSLHTLLALVASGVLLAGGTGLIWWLEHANSLQGLATRHQLLASFFQSVTTRTAGFNTLDIGSLAPATLFVMILLMFIGGSPGSCAGGIKTTTLAVLVLTARSRLSNRRHVNAFGRTVSPTAVQNTLAITISGAAVVVAGLFAMLLLEGQPVAADTRHGVFIAYLFETISALGTVGLSTGVTSELEPATRLLVSLLMFVGRLGPLSVAAALLRETPLSDWQYPEEDVMVG